VSERDAQEERSALGLPRLPPGRHGLAREFVVRNQRDRLTAGVIAAVAGNGYHEATVSRICGAAGVSRRTFYTYFASKEECYVEALDRIVDHLVAAMGTADDSVEWPEQVRDRFAALLDGFAANPDLVRFTLIAPLRAGEQIAAHQRAAFDRLFDELIRGRPSKGVRRAPRAVEQALVGGSMALIAHRVEGGNASSLPDLLPDLVELFLTPFVGRKKAAGVARSSP
jgi:AcrR family transcriptional regulator